MKKIISLILITGILVSTALGAFAKDYDNHWAKKDIDNLILSGIISGDDEGNINPDDFITRAEFVKMTNKAFEYTDKSFENFSDVNKEEWFYDEFLTAKAYGYITGDENGNANPKANITRGEVAVVLARVLKLITGYTDNSFLDNNEIPAWAKGSIVALCKEGYISGYPDKTFRAEKSMTRGEAISIISKYKNNKKDNKEENKENNKAPVTSVPTTSVKGGGGGGGGSSSTPAKTLSQPIIANADNEQLVLKWKSVSGADSYEILMSVLGESYTIITEEPSYDFNKKIDEITADKNDSQYEIKAKIKAISKKSNVKDSSYSKEISMVKTYPSLETPVLTYKSGQTGSVNRGVVKIGEVENADSYKISLTVDGEPSENYEYNKEKSLVIIEDTAFLYNKDGILSVKAISKDHSTCKDSKEANIKIVHSIPNVSGSQTEGKGTEEEPFIIKNAEGIELMRTNSSAYFVLSNDIILPPDFEPIPEFKGTLATNGEQRIINISLRKPNTNDVGFISVMDGGTLRNIILTGVVEGETYVGGFVGYMKNGKIENCINMAEVIGSRGNIGGIVGTTSKGSITGSGTIKGCINTGTVRNLPTRTGGYVGGIIGYSHASVIDSINLGDVISQNNGTGGICGITYSAVTRCYNMGSVNSPVNAGGIVGLIRLAKPPIDTCFNGGAVNAKFAAGIIGGFWNTASVCAINNSYSFGELNGTDKNDYVVYNNFGLTKDKISCSNVYYLDESKNDAEYSGSYPLTDSELQSLELEGFYKDDSFKYPVISGVPYITKDSIRVWNYDPQVNYFPNGNGITIDWTAPSDDATGIELTIIDKYDFSEVVSGIELPAATDSYFMENYNNHSYYDIKLRLIYNENKTDYKTFEVFVNEDL